MIAWCSAGFVALALWLLSLPTPAGIRLASVVPRPRAGRPALWWVERARTAARRGKDVARRRAAVIELCDGLAVELSAGRPPPVALASAAEVLAGGREFMSAVEAAKIGDDVAAVLDRTSELPGCEGLRLLAGCWRIGVERGGMLAAVVDGLAGALRDEQAHREEVRLQLAGPRATARLLAGLPVLGIGMAVALGADPLAFLFGSLPGAGCLVLGVGLDVLGLTWTRRLAVAAEEPR